MDRSKFIRVQNLILNWEHIGCVYTADSADAYYIKFALVNGGMHVAKYKTKEERDDEFEWIDNAL